MYRKYRNLSNLLKYNVTIVCHIVEDIVLVQNHIEEDVELVKLYIFMFTKDKKKEYLPKMIK
jgi:hypothetical protein